jgi:hypothetical protein
LFILGLFIVVFESGCKKEENVTFTDNTIPHYDEVPSIIIENYVNRVFIDLIGREPTDLEMITEAAALKSANMSVASRTALVNKIMTSTDILEGDGSYREAYIRKFYEDQKGRFLEGSSEANILEQMYIYESIAYSDSLNGNVLGYQVNSFEAAKLEMVLDSREELQLDSIVFEELCYRMMYNSIYDDINMNTFNFINATFDDCFSRFPTESEYEEIYPSIEYNGAGMVFFQIVNNKDEYLNALINSYEFDEGLVRWCYRALLARDASSYEVYTLAPLFASGSNFSAVQRNILISDEYAGI